MIFLIHELKIQIRVTKIDIGYMKTRGALEVQNRASLQRIKMDINCC